MRDYESFSANNLGVSVAPSETVTFLGIFFWKTLTNKSRFWRALPLKINTYWPLRKISGWDTQKKIS